MKVTRFYATADGESRFEELEIPVETEAENALGVKFLASNDIPTSGVRLLELPVGFESGWHNVAAPLIGLVLAGRLEAETSDGQKRQWGPLDAFLADDSTGKGHNGRVLEGPVRALYIFLPADFDVAGWKA